MSRVAFSHPQEEAKLHESILRCLPGMRRELEATRVEYAEAQDLAGLLAVATVADQLDEWEKQSRTKLTRWQRKHGALPGAGRSPADMGHGCPAVDSRAGSAAASSGPSRGRRTDYPSPAPSPAEPLFTRPHSERAAEGIP